MIEVTVRTLDSQNHKFTVEEEITVAEFKAKIAETVNIAADTQRIIYCGRVLNDESKLREYDVNGKVVHLVARAPPSEQTNRSRAQSPPSRTRGPVEFEGLDGLPRNTMYHLGSMAIPMERQNLVPPPPSHSLAASRLNVARRMLRRADLLLNLLDNPSARASDTNVPEEPLEEATPVFEARVIVPNISHNPIEQAFVLNAVQNRLINATATIGSSDEASAGSAEAGGAEVPTAAASTTNLPEVDEVAPEVAQTTPRDVSPSSAATEDATSSEPADGATSGASNSTSRTESVSHTSEMCELLDSLGRLQTRFAPHLERYHNFMREDPVVATDEARSTQTMMNRVSEVLHFLGHAYHSLSDIIVRVRPAPPRPLLCRPILIQHSAVVQAGFPIQVEAQINFASEPMMPNNTTGTQTAAGATTTGQQPPNISVNPNILGFPLRAGSGFHVQSIPIGIRTIPRAAAGAANAGAANADGAANGNAMGGASLNGVAFDMGAAMGGAMGNPNMEFFMEVTPESITIDSLETALLGSQGEGMHGEVPPPELLQSIVQMANNLVNRGAHMQQQQQQEQQNDAASTDPSATNGTPAPNAAGQNSQARGNTQTHPTTSTHTRSTARPHVHLAQHAMQGFDPFLPCNSHHINNRRSRAQTRHAANNNEAGANAEQGPEQFNPVYNSIIQGVLNSLQNVYTRQRGEPQAGVTPQSTPTSGGAAQAGTSANAGANVSMDLHQLFASMPNFANLLPHLQTMGTSQMNARGGPTIAQLLQQAGDQPDADGIFNDLIMLLSRNFTIGDMLQLNSGRLDPLLRIRNELRNFCLERILEGNANAVNLDRGVNRLLVEIQPFLENIRHLSVNDDIDILRSTQMLFRTRLPNIINLATARTPNSIRMLVDQCRVTARHLCALLLFASSNGQRGVEDVLGRVVATYMEGISTDLQQWTLLATRAQLQQFMRTLNIPSSILQPYIVRNVDSVTILNSEAMDVDDTKTDVNGETNQSSCSNTILGSINVSLDSEEMPTVVFGSEQWHGQVPTEWVPIIARDEQRQRRQNQQSPLSDAYLSGMPSKRRKIVTNTKPQGSLPQVIAESIRRAVTSTGLSAIANLEAVSHEAGSDINIQSAYRDLLRTNVQSSIQDNEEFTPDRFPNASNYFSKSH